MKRARAMILAVLLLIPGLTLACGSLQGLRGPETAEQAFVYAQALYRDALAVAVAYSDQCVANPNVDCAQMVQKLDDSNQKAQSFILAGELLLDGFVPPELACDEEASPGCTERLVDQRLLSLSGQIQSVSATVMSVQD